MSERRMTNHQPKLAKNHQQANSLFDHKQRGTLNVLEIKKKKHFSIKKQNEESPLDHFYYLDLNISPVIVAIVIL